MSEPTQSATDRFLVACLSSGEECFSSGFFRSLKEARFEMSRTLFFACPECGGPLTIETVKAGQ